MQHNKHIYRFIIAVALIKIFFSAFIELGNDESYYYTYALQPQLNYFDHPPMVGLLIRLTTLNLFWVNDVSLRLGAILSCSIASLFVYKTVNIWSNNKAAWYAVLLYNFSVYTGVIAGFFILPDSLQMPFWCAALWMMSKIIVLQNEKKTLLWLLLGFFIGLATLCKIHSLYLWAGFGLYILFYKPKWLLNFRVYLSFIVTVVCCLPIIIWNIQNDFITYKFHSERVANTQINIASFLQELIGEALYQNPIVYLLIVYALYQIVKKLLHKSKVKVGSTSLAQSKPNYLPFFLLLGLPMVFLFWYLSMFNDILPHWSGPGYITLSIIASIILAQKTDKKNPIITTIAGSLLLIVFVALTLLIHFYPSNFGSKNKENFGEGCPTLDISGWKNMSKDFAELYAKDTAEKNIKNPVLLVNKWFPACQFELYTSRKTKIPVIAIGNLEDVHQFAWLNKERPKIDTSTEAYCIVPSNQPININSVYGNYFKTIELAKTIEQKRGGKVVRYFNVYRLKKCIKIPAEILPKKI